MAIYLKQAFRDTLSRHENQYHRTHTNLSSITLKTPLVTQLEIGQNAQASDCPACYRRSRDH